MPSYMTLTSTPSFTFSSSTFRILSHMYPRSTIKYSMKIKCRAALSSLMRASNLSSPSGKYSTWVLP